MYRVVTMDTKRCNKCFETKSYDDFHSNKTMKDGKSYYCKQCKNEEYQINKKEIIERSIQWRADNLEQWKKNAKKARKNYNAKHPEIHARRQLNKKVREKLKKPTSVYSPTISCSSLFLREWIEKQFASDMNWSNHGTVWNIDHIVPLCAFDLFQQQERLYCNHYLNLRPIYVKLNEKKGFKYNPEDKAILIEQIKNLNTNNPGS